MPPRAKRQEKTVGRGSAALNKDFLTASEISGAADLPNGTKRAAAGKSASDNGKPAKSPKRAAEAALGKAKTASDGRFSAITQSPASDNGKPAKSPKRAAKGAVDAEKADENAVSCKTPQVMKLISDDSMSNPVIVAGKSRIPTRLRGREPLSRVLKRQLHGEPLETSEAEVVNLTEIAVKYEAPLILDRFNACSCEKCVKVFSEMTLMKVAARYARISKSSPEVRARELNNRVEPVLRTVQIAMIRELIGCKKRVFHDE